MRKRYAVLIGVNNYIPYDVANGNSPGTSNLRGCVNDAQSAFYLCRRLGYPEENIRVLSNPTITPGMINSDQVRCGPATAASIRDALDWLLEQCSAGGEEAVGIVYFSGHGDFQAENQGMVFPYDYTGVKDKQGDDRVVHLASLTEGFKERGNGATLVLMVDACRAEGGPLSHTQDEPLNAAPESCILITACAPGQKSYERCIYGDWRGLFGWAMSTIIGQWSLVPDSENGWYLNLSYDELIERVNLLPQALSTAAQVQTATLYTSEENQQRAVGQLSSIAPGDTSEDPTGPSNGHEFGADTNATFKLNNQNGAVFATMAVDSDGKATWYFDPSYDLFSNVSAFALELAYKKWYGGSDPTGQDWNEYTSTSTALTNTGSTSIPTVSFASADGKKALVVSGSTLTWYKAKAFTGTTTWIYKTTDEENKKVQTYSSSNSPSLGSGETWYSGGDSLS
ncbi:MAG: caspase family protein [Alphaproteobacteria bacterium]|nr:caspase family protein [Alphaproteobacteria bacterium]